MRDDPFCTPPGVPKPSRRKMASCAGLADLLWCVCVFMQQMQDVPANKEKLSSEDEQVVMQGVIYFREQLSGVWVGLGAQCRWQ